MPSTWNPDQYNRFRAERQQPFYDLLALVQPRPNLRAVDLGCGTGELTRVLHERLALRDTLGLDSSETMLADSASHAVPGLRFERGDINEFEADGGYDLVFSNAALHWLPDHPALFARLGAALAPAGQLAVQMPYNFDHSSHTAAAAVAREEPFDSALRGFIIERPVLAPEEYAALLHRLGFHSQHVRLQVYAHVLPARDDVVEWVKGTLLTEYQRRLPRERLIPSLDSSTPFFYPFKRILLWAER
jgi:trans-aconitate 2-methyltransferase